MPDQPNVLLLYVDQQRGDALGCAGNPDVLTPNLDALAARGTRFDRHYVQNPVCMPSRLSMLTGRYPSNTGVTHMAVPVPEDTEHLATHLGRAGYRTANLGKLHFLPHSNRDHSLPHPSYGFDHLEISDEPGPYDDAYRAHVRRTMPDQLEHISKHVYPPAAAIWREQTVHRDPVEHPETWDPWRTVPFAGADEATHTAFVGQRTIDYVRRDHGTPFFCIAGIYSPHSPLVAPQRFLDLYDPAALTVEAYPPELREAAEAKGFTDAHLRQMTHGYYAMISEVDHWVGRIMEHVPDNTVVAFTSDHGEFLGDQLALGKGYPGPDSVSRVPLIVATPDGKRGHVCEEVVEAVDLAPTLLQLAGVPVPSYLDGTSLVPALTGGSPTLKRGGALMEDDMRREGPWRSLRDDRYRYILLHDGTERLFDCDAEFGEYRDVAADEAYREILLTKRHEMATRLLNVVTPEPRTWCY